jgi:Ser/Thr protein kinase RdoA (MazF antagonist)
MSLSTSQGQSSDSVLRVARQFGMSPTSVSRVTDGHINESYFVETPDGAYVVQRINRSVFSDPDGIMGNLLVVHRSLGGALVPAPVAAVDGRWLVEDGADVWRALERVPKGVAPGAPTVDNAGRAGELLGFFHARVAAIDPQVLVVTLPRFHDVGRRLDDLLAVVSADPHGRLDTCADEVDLARSGAPLVALAQDFEVRTPLRVVHNDAKLENFVFRDGEAVSIVDLDTLMPGRSLWDVGDLVRSASTSAPEDETDLARVVVDPARYGAIMAGYRRGVGDAATDVEIEAADAAGAIATYEQALRFLTDWLAGDVYFRTLRPRHNLDRARAQFRLLRSMPHSPL